MTAASARISGDGRGRLSRARVAKAACSLVLMLAIADLISKNWAVFKGAWFIELVVWLLALGIGWGAHALLAKAERGALNERLRLRDDQIADLKSKVGTASPDEIKARIDGLEARLADIASIVPRRLNKEQKATLRAALAAPSDAPTGPVRISVEDGVDDGHLYSLDFQEALTESGWKAPLVQRDRVGRVRSQCGLCLRVVDPSALTPIQRRLADALKAAGLQFDVHGELTNFPDVGFTASKQKYAAEIFISRKMIT